MAKWIHRVFIGHLIAVLPRLSAARRLPGSWPEQRHLWHKLRPSARRPSCARGPQCARGSSCARRRLRFRARRPLGGARAPRRLPFIPISAARWTRLRCASRLRRYFEAKEISSLQLTEQLVRYASRFMKKFYEQLFKKNFFFFVNVIRQ